jgi:hypothetical protein
VGVQEILVQIDAEIARLKHARALLAGKPAPAAKKAAAPAAAKKPSRK